MKTQPKEVPILFSTAMVEAIVAGRKTQTRRIINPQPRLGGNGVWQFKGPKGGAGGPEAAAKYIPKCQQGDLIYVREQHYAFGRWLMNGISKKTVKQKLRFSDETLENGFSYQYPNTFRHQVSKGGVGWHKRNSMFMPKAAARIWLRCTGVRAERVQSISQEDAVAEGVGWHPPFAYQAFAQLWHSINGKEGWDANPWVWVYEFGVLSTNGKPENI
jgi:hypothetical protein